MCEKAEQARANRPNQTNRRPLQTWQDAELFAEQWMHANGYPDAHRTGPGADGGLDVISRDAVCQVKPHAKPVGVSEIQRLAGIASHLNKKAIFFSLNGYTPQAKKWGDLAGVKCLTYRARS
nr:restriction endonuclease [Rhodococcus kyotonensis]